MFLDKYYMICHHLFVLKVFYVWYQSGQLRHSALFLGLSFTASGLGDVVRAFRYTLPYLEEKEELFSHLPFFLPQQGTQDH